MGGIPVLNDKQMNALRRIVGTNQKFNLTVVPKGKNRRLPSYSESVSETAGYNGMFKLVVLESGGNYYIRLVDGATYSEVDYSQNHVCGIVGFAGNFYELKTVETEISPNNTFYFYVCKTARGFSIFTSTSYRGYSQYTPNILIGRADFSGDEPQIYQDHLTGAIRLDTPYNGMFSVDIFAENSNGELSYKFKVRGGDAYANMTYFSVDDLPADAISTGTTYIYFSVEYDTSDHTFQNGRIYAYSSTQGDTQYKKYILIATLLNSGGNITVLQHQYGVVRIFFWGECDHGDE